MQPIALFISDLNIYDYVPWALYKLIHNNMLTSDHNRINETKIRVNGQDGDDWVVLIKNHWMHGSGFHMQGPFNKLGL